MRDPAKAFIWSFKNILLGCNLKRFPSTRKASDKCFCRIKRNMPRSHGSRVGYKPFAKCKVRTIQSYMDGPKQPGAPFKSRYPATSKSWLRAYLFFLRKLQCSDVFMAWQEQTTTSTGSTGMSLSHRIFQKLWHFLHNIRDIS